MADRARTLYVPPLRVDITTREGVRVPAPMMRIGRAMLRAAREAGAPLPASVGLVLTDDAELARLNRRHMGASGPTDVLSFPLLPPEAFGHSASRRDSRRPGSRAMVFPSPPGARTALGDIAISVERAVAQARDGLGGQDCRTRWDARDELLLLAVHGTLHLCGFDHAEPDQDRLMRALERRVLAAP